MMELKKNQLHTVLIEGYSSEGHGVCRVGGRAVFVPRAIAGERWTIRIVKVTASAVYARGEENLSPSAERLTPLCPYFTRCGGCDLWHMTYTEELRFKLGRVNDALTHIGKQAVRCEEILGSESITRYRNKGIFAVAEHEPYSSRFVEHSFRHDGEACVFFIGLRIFIVRFEDEKAHFH